MDYYKEFYKTAIGITRCIPSEETLRQRMDDMGDRSGEQILNVNVELLLANNIQPSALPDGMVHVDIDVTPMDNSNTSKQGDSRTYNGFDGHAVNFELREGKQHCQNGTVELLFETINLCKKLTDKSLLVRLDSGNDSLDNVAVLIENGCYFIIKRNLQKESSEELFQMVKTYWKDITIPREVKTVYIGGDWKEVANKRFEKDFTLRAGYEITERTIDKKGQFLLPADIEVETWWTNLDKSDHEIIKLYYAHGEYEQYHSEVKNDMDVERLPSGKFKTNALVLELTVIAYNILRRLSREPQASVRQDRREMSSAGAYVL